MDKSSTVKAYKALSAINLSTDALRNLDSSFLKDNVEFVETYKGIKWDDINSLNKLISLTEQIVVKYKDPNDVIQMAIETIFVQVLQEYPLLFGYWKKFTAVQYQLHGLDLSLIHI